MDRGNRASVIVNDKENLNPNSLAIWRSSKAAKSANAFHLQHSANDAATTNFPQSTYAKLSSAISMYNIAFCILVKALIIAVLINFHLASMLSRFHFDTSLHVMKETLIAARDSDEDILACVRNVGRNCQLYPCIKDDNGEFIETDTPESPFGYAGRFVHRDDLVEKPLMQTIGDKGWGSGCVVSDEYKFVYIHVLKSGGTATKEFLRKSLCGEEDIDCKKVDPHILRPSGCRAAILNYTDYFTFSFVRNPFSRMYSMYSMMDGFPLEPGQKVTNSFSFRDFVLKPRERKNHTTMHAGHYDRQKNFIFSNHTCPSFDFLGRVEHYDEDMKTILNHLEATKLLQYLDNIGGSVKPANTWGENKKQSIGGDLRQEYSSREVIKRVASVYRKDFDLLGYDRYVVPSN
ncbi:hypothetical protein ACHAXN_012513 [Cyclotella atomus]